MGILVKLLVVLALATGLSACAARGFVFLPQVGVIANVQNNCAPYVSIHSIYGEVWPLLEYGRDKTVAVESRPFSGYHREIWIRVKAYKDKARTQFIGSYTFVESVDIRRGTRDVELSLDQLDSPSGAQCQTSP